MRVGPWKIRVDWGHLIFITVIAVLTAYYLAEVLSVSRHINNTILVRPFSILVLGLCLLVMVGSVHFDRAEISAAAGETPPPEKGDSAQSRADIIRSVVLLAGLGAYVLVYPLIGMDLTTFLFVAGALILLGERRPVFTLLYAAVFTVIIAGGARWMLPYPMPMAFF